MFISVDHDTGLVHHVVCVLSLVVTVPRLPTRDGQAELAWADNVALMFISVAHDTGLVHHVVCVLSLVLTVPRLPARDGQAELARVAGYTPRWFAVARPSTNRA